MFFWGQPQYTYDFSNLSLRLRLKSLNLLSWLWPNYNIRGVNSHSTYYKIRNSHSMKLLKIQLCIKIAQQLYTMGYFVSTLGVFSIIRSKTRLLTFTKCKTRPNIFSYFPAWRCAYAIIKFQWILAYLSL